MMGAEVPPNTVFADRREFAKFCNDTAELFDRLGAATGCCDVARAEALRFAAAAIVRGDHTQGDQA